MKTKLILSLLLALAVYGNYLGYSYVYRIYDRYNDLKLDPLGNLYSRDLRAPSGHFETVVIGDSHAANWPSAEGILNLGIASQTSTQIRMRSYAYRGSVSGRRLIVFAGANDMKSLMTNPGGNARVVSATLRNIETIVRNHDDDFEWIYLMTIPPVFRLPILYWPLYREDIPAAIAQVNEGIRAIASQDDKVVLIDAERILRAQKDVETLSEDGIHLSDLAYGYIRAAIKDFERSGSVPDVISDSRP